MLALPPPPKKIQTRCRSRAGSPCMLAKGTALQRPRFTAVTSPQLPRGLWKISSKGDLPTPLFIAVGNASSAPANEERCLQERRPSSRTRRTSSKKSGVFLHKIPAIGLLSISSCKMIAQTSAMVLVHVLLIFSCQVRACCGFPRQIFNASASRNTSHDLSLRHASCHWVNETGWR